MKRSGTFGLLLMLCALPVAAQTPPQPAGTAPAANQPMAPANPPVIGRLFFTPEERARLDELRRRPPAARAPQVAEAKPEAAPPQQPPGPEYITLNGIVRRSDGSTTVWLNNKPVTGPRTDEGIVVTPAARAGAGNVVVRVPQTGRSVELKVGQQLEVQTGQVQEAYESPRAIAAAMAPEAKPAEAAPPAPPAPVRRSNRERDLLRDLLREIEGQEAGEQAASKRPPNIPTR